MRKLFSMLLIVVFLILPLATSAQKTGFPTIKQLQSPQNPRLGFVIHGGAGVIRRGDLSPEMEKEYRAKLEEAVVAGYKALQNGKTSLDAVQIAINILEDSPLFNAGKGAVFNAEGKNELDSPNHNHRQYHRRIIFRLEFITQLDRAFLNITGKVFEFFFIYHFCYSGIIKSIFCLPFLR